MNHSGCVSSAGDWNNEKEEKLWLYNLHYFDYLLQDKHVSNIQIKSQIDLIENWINNNAFGKGTAWEPYPTSVRIINWIKWHQLCRGLSEKAKLIPQRTTSEFFDYNIKWDKDRHSRIN